MDCPVKIVVLTLRVRVGCAATDIFQGADTGGAQEEKAPPLRGGITRSVMSTIQDPPLARRHHADA
jgi:hypothetical protein